jgi:hypothetical protein
MANSGALPLSAAPGLLVECLPIIGGVTKEEWVAFGDFLAAVAFAKEYVGAVLDLNGDALSNFSGTVQIARPSLPPPTVAFGIPGQPPSFLGTKPTAIYFSTDLTVSIRGITWSSWGASGATGRGTWYLVNCTPDCATGPIQKYPATLTISNAQNGLFTVPATTGNGQTTIWHYPDDWPHHT